MSTSCWPLLQCFCNRWFFVAILLIVTAIGSRPQLTYAQCAADSTAKPQSNSQGQIQQLFAAHEWDKVAQLAQSQPARTADDNFAYGMALAHLQRWADARVALMAGARQCPRQKRFPIELGGIEFEQKRYAQAAAWLRRGLKLDPADDYANNFAGTVYYLMGNLPAALQYWNRVQRPGPKPNIGGLNFDPQLRLQRSILDRAFVFSPQAQLTLPAYEATQARLNSLGIFSTYKIDLNAQPDGTFNADFHALERNGFGSSRVAALIAVFAGTPYQTIYPSYYNLRGSDLNFQSLLRWDKEKRRAWADVSAPVYARPQLRWSLSTDERDENWLLRRSSTGTAPPLGALNLESQHVTGEIAGLHGGRLQWFTGAELSHRTYRNVSEGSALTPSLVSPGYELKYLAGATYQAVSLPEHRLTITTSANSETGRLWSTPPRAFEKLTGSALAQWFPQAQGDKYEVTQKVRSGGTLGAPPFDELYLLGMDRDSNLDLRGEIATRDGRKGSSPLGTNYLLSNTDFYRRVYSNGLFTLKAGPLFDIAKVSAPTTGLSTRDWIFNTGVEAKISVLGTSIVLSYGRDLRTGGNAFFGTLAQ